MYILFNFIFFSIPKKHFLIDIDKVNAFSKHLD